MSARTESIVSASVSVVAGRRAEAAAAAAERMNNIPRMNINMVDACEDQSSTDSSWSNVSQSYLLPWGAGNQILGKPDTLQIICLIEEIGVAKANGSKVRMKLIIFHFSPGKCAVTMHVIPKI